MELRDAKVLISGASGFLGSHLTRRLTSLGARVHLLARQGSSFDRLSDLRPIPPCTRAELDDAAALSTCVREVRPDIVFLVAGVTSDRGRGATKGVAVGHGYHVNVIGTLRLLHAIALEAPAARVIRIGSFAEYGVGPVPFVEGQREEPVSPYAASMVAATSLGQTLYRQLGLAVTTLRVGLAYGPAQVGNFLIPSLISACLAGRPFDVPSATQTRELLYVDDLLDALVAATAAPGLEGEIVNVGSGREHGIGDVAALIVRLAGASIELRIGNALPEPGVQPRQACDPERARRLLDWQARTSLEEGLARTIGWYRANLTP